MIKDKTYLTTSLIIILLLFLDQITKIIFTGKEFFKGNPISILYVENFGSGFGIFSNVSFYLYFIIILSIIILSTLTYHKKHFLKDSYLRWGFILVVSGIGGNLIDRVIFGFVRDFLYLKNLFIFNFADLYLTLAFILFLLYEFKNRK